MTTSSNTFYRINGQIDYEPQNHILRHCSTNVEVTLFAPASRCLLLLIEKQNTIIKQQELMLIGWEMHGLSVSPNAFYQNIANIRRAFNELLPGLEVITTIKRVGLLISNEVNIESIGANPEVFSERIQDPDIYIDSYSTFRKKYNLTISLTICLIALLFLASSIVYYRYQLEKNTLFFNQYTLYGKSNSGCDVFINKLDNEALIYSDMQIINTMDCKKFNQAYITRWPEWTRTSIVLCSMARYPSDELSCTTYFYESNYQ
ncbi:Uncharacterised protein [Pragia fontium]|nr:Uncharacterised protein [Pragia fontium]